MPERTLPVRISEVTCGWLSEALRLAGVLPEGRVVHVESMRLGQQGVTSETYRLALAYDHDAGPSTPRGLIVKLASLDPATRATMQALGAYERELLFYEHLARYADVRAPSCYFAGREPETGEFVLLLEAVQGEPGIPTLQALEQTLCEIAKLHTRFWNAPELADLAWFKHSAAVEAAHEQQICAVAQRVVARTGPSLPPAFAEALAFGSAHLRELRELEHLRPRTVVHGDLHPGQIITSADGPVIFDWQTATIGSPGRDVARVIAMSLPPMPRERHEHHMLAVYHAALERHGVRGYSLRECYEDYQRGLVASALINAFVIAELDEDKLLSSRAVGEPTFVRVLIDYVDSALVATGALTLLRGEVGTLAVAA